MGASYKISNLLHELETRKASHGAKHRCVVETLCILGLTYAYVEHDYDKALYYHIEALQILVSEKTNQRQVINVATTLSDIGNCHLACGEHVIAKRIFLQAKLVMDKSKLSDEHPRNIMFAQSLQRRLDYMNQSKYAVTPLENPVHKCKSSMIKSDPKNNTIESRSLSNEHRRATIDFSCFQL